jgi:S1-C subfamily serine protease
VTKAAPLLLLCGCATAAKSTDLTPELWLEAVRPIAVLSPSLRDRPAPLQGGAKGDIREVYRKVAPAVVLIRTPTGFGTGIIINAAGYVLTNHHVIAQAEQVDFKRRVSVELGQLGPQGFMEKRGEPLTGWVLKSDPLVDLAVLKLETPPKDLVAVQVSDADPVPGEPVSAIGHGGIGLLWAIRDGEVASVGRLATHLAQLVGAECQQTDDPELAAKCATSRKSIEAERARVADQVPGLVIQTSCTLSPGDSGGPLVNRAGQLVGVNAFLQPDPTAPVAANFHVHVAEVRTFLKNVPAEPVSDVPNPYELIRGHKTQVIGDATVAVLAHGVIAFVSLGDTHFVIAKDNGRRMVWRGDGHMVIESKADSGRGAEWIWFEPEPNDLQPEPEPRPPLHQADDVLLLDVSKLSPAAAARYAKVLDEVLVPWGLAPKQPLEHMPSIANVKWKRYDEHSRWSDSGDVQLDPDITIVRRGKRAWWKTGDLLLATEDADSGAADLVLKNGVPQLEQAGGLFASLGLQHLSGLERQRAKEELQKLAPAFASDDLLDVGPNRTQEDPAVESISGPRGVGLLIRLSGPGVDMAWIRRGDAEWFLYDTDGKGSFDVTLYKPKRGVRPSLFKDEHRRTAFEALAKAFFSPDVCE